MRNPTPSRPTRPLHVTLKLSIEDLRRDVATNLFPAVGSAGPDLFGMEVEVFPFVEFGSGAPKAAPAAATFAAEHSPRALGLSAADGYPGAIELVQAFAAQAGLEALRPGDSPDPELAGADGRFTFEPGGQIEFSCAPRRTPAAAYDATARALDGLEVAVREHGIRLISLGTNPWAAPGEVALQTDVARYVCMDRYFASIGPAGELMMRRTAAAHVNIDLGPASRATLRWRASQALSPLALATFAFSPLESGMHRGLASLRGTAWRKLDRSRTGFPDAFLRDPFGKPVEHYLDFGLEARVMLVRGSRSWKPQTDGVTFAQWMERGIDGGYPTLDDWHYHLTTLFPEVRAKGFLEVRSADAQARPFRSVPLTWWAALLCDDESLGAVLERLEPTLGDLGQRWDLAAHEGLGNPELAADAKALYGWASESLLRAPAGTYSQEMVRAFLVFGERFALRGRAPADELLEIFLDRGGLDGEGWDALVHGWSEAVGLPTAAERALGEQTGFRP